MGTFWKRRSRQEKLGIIGAVVLAVIVLIGVASPSDKNKSSGASAQPAENTQCIRVTRPVAAGIAWGLTTSGHGKLMRARAVRAEDTRGIPIYLVSADINAPGLRGRNDIGTWAVERSVRSELDMGGVMAVDSVAQEFSDWGAAATPGSRADQWRDSLREDDAYEQSRECATG
jgi:hypothetical protein